jgi:phage-related protein
VLCRRRTIHKSPRVFKSVAKLKTAITDYLEKHNAGPKPFVWTRSTGEILEKVARAKQALEPKH